MSTIIPTLDIDLSGNGILTSLSKSITWENGEKLEQDYKIVDTDGQVTINYSYVDNIALMIFESSASFKVTFTMNDGNTIDFEVDSIFIFNPTSNFLSNVTSIAISTVQTTTITVSIRIYGSV